MVTYFFGGTLVKMKLKRSKLALAIIGLVILSAIAAGFILKNQFEPGLWTFWFIAFNGTLAIYAGANVTQKGVLKNGSIESSIKKETSD